MYRCVYDICMWEYVYDAYVSAYMMYICTCQHGSRSSKKTLGIDPCFPPYFVVHYCICQFRWPMRLGKVSLQWTLGLQMHPSVPSLSWVLDTQTQALSLT